MPAVFIVWERCLGFSFYGIKLEVLRVRREIDSNVGFSVRYFLWRLIPSPYSKVRRDQPDI